MTTTSRLVKWDIQSFIGPIRECQKYSLIGYLLAANEKICNTVAYTKQYNTVKRLGRNSQMQPQN